jgi:PAS domain S-box-containing protein
MWPANLHSPEDHPAPHGDPERLTVLYVEDDEAKRCIWKDALYKAFTVVEAGSGEDGLRAIQQVRPDVVLLAVKLPDLHGFEVCRRIKNISGNENVPVAHISAYFDSDESRVRGLENGADSFLNGDESPEVVVATLKALVRLSRLRDPESDNRVYLLASIVEQSENAIVSTDPDGRIVSWNRGAEKLYGYAASEAIGRSPTFLYPPERKKDWPLLMEQLDSGEPVFYYETERVRKDGTLVNVSLSVSQILDRSNRVVGLAAIGTDITDRVRDREKIDAMNSELRRLSGHLLRMQDQERRRIAREIHDGAVQDLAGLALHLTALEGLDSVRGDPAAAKAVHDCLAHANASSRGLRTLSYLLHPPLLEELGLANTLMTFTEGFARRTGIAVDLELPEEFPRIESDRELALFRIVQESLANVHKHSGSPDAGIRAVIEDRNLTLEIEDHGRGIPGAPFQMAANGVVLGVGMPGMQERARQLGGSLEIDSRPGRTVIRVRLPLQ